MCCTQIKLVREFQKASGRTGGRAGVAERINVSRSTSAAVAAAAAARRRGASTMADGGDVGYSFPVLNSKQIVGYLSDVHIHVSEEVIMLAVVLA